jgi:hypothetical protein
VGIRDRDARMVYYGLMLADETIQYTGLTVHTLMRLDHLNLLSTDERESLYEALLMIHKGDFHDYEPKSKLPVTKHSCWTVSPCWKMDLPPADSVNMETVIRTISETLTAGLTTMPERFPYYENTNLTWKDLENVVIRKVQWASDLASVDFERAEGIVDTIRHPLVLAIARGLPSPDPILKAAKDRSIRDIVWIEMTTKRSISGAIETLNLSFMKRILEISQSGEDPSRFYHDGIEHYLNWLNSAGKSGDFRMIKIVCEWVAGSYLDSCLKNSSFKTEWVRRFTYRLHKPNYFSIPHIIDQLKKLFTAYQTSVSELISESQASKGGLTQAEKKRVAGARKVAISLLRNLIPTPNQSKKRSIPDEIVDLGEEDYGTPSSSKKTK